MSQWLICGHVLMRQAHQCPGAYMGDFNLNMSKELWFEIKIPGDYRALSEEYGVSPVMARLLHNRGVQGREAVHSFLDADDTGQVYAYEKLPDIEKCTDILEEKIRSGAHIRVIGDYDIDGVCSTYILTCGLHKLGASVDYAIPHRINDGYGLNDRLIREACDAGVDCIITCDNGITAAPQIQLAHELGMTVIVTDHHEVPYHMSGDERIEDIPDADAVVDIKRGDSRYGFTEICGAQVAFKVLAAICDRLRDRDREAMEGLFEFAAFASIGDIMPLTGENRYLVKTGLKALRTTCNKGMRALMRVQGIEGKELEPYHVGFILGPCINATGRLATAENAYELLAAEDDVTAERLAGMLCAMNEDRKDMTERGVKKAEEMSDSEPYLSDRVLVIYLPDTHESIAGIIAGKVREHSGKPTFVLTDGEGCIKGSGRSIDEYDMHEAMTEVADIFDKFGGHRMAAGLSLADGVTPEDFRERINSVCRLTDSDLDVKIRFDMQLPFSFVTAELAGDMERLGPFGVGNTKPLFAAKDVTLHNAKLVGRNSSILRCNAVDPSGRSVSAVCFRDGAALMRLAETRQTVRLLYSVEINEYMGKRSVQIRIEHFC